MNKKILDHILGVQDDEGPLREKVLLSRRLFVRDQDHLSLANDRATGRKMTAFEVLDTFGERAFEEIYDHGSAILPIDYSEPAASMKEQRLKLGLSIEQLAKRARLDAVNILAAENPDVRTPFRVLEQIAVALGLDERYLSVKRGAGGDAELAFRLKTIRYGSDDFSDKTVSILSQAAWVIRVQHRLQEYFGYGFNLPAGIVPSSNYGYSGSPPWREGYELAKLTRSALSIADESPVESIRALCFDLRIPLISATLPRAFAGATVEVGGVRGIVINTVGDNQNVWVRRATIAHELGHLLWDPDQQLKRLRIDRYEVLKAPYREGGEPVEARANAFAVEFLAPQLAVVRTYQASAQPADGLRHVMDRYGISMTAAKYHISNGFGGSPEILKLRVDNFPEDDWMGRESYTNEYFPLAETSQLRRGDFSGWVVAAERSGFISLDTAATYLEVECDKYLEGADTVAQLFPEIMQLASAGRRRQR